MILTPCIRKLTYLLNLFEQDFEHLREFGLSWDLLHKHLFYTEIYRDPAVYGNLPGLITQLRFVLYKMPVELSVIWGYSKWHMRFQILILFFKSWKIVKAILVIAVERVFSLPFLMQFLFNFCL